MGFFSKLLLKIMGWDPNPHGAFPIRPRKCVIIVAPHTSNWDFVIAVLYRSALGLEKARYLGKKELFTPWFGWFFRWLGGTPVDRHASHNVVEQVVEIFNRHQDFILALSPEGTRKKVERLRTGFYQIALQANVPIVMAALDFANKKVTFSEPFKPTGNLEEDFKYIIDFFRPVKGKYPEQGLMHL
ncbi:MAG: lysophospholipid acyltransferase family protein [Cyclobacteriaceae bacterium]|nr:lysophospholipid acyltransferase family protein [Cyclobacteriaceae bacterium]